MEKNIPTGIYYVLPAQVHDDDRLSDFEILLYILLSGLSFSDGYCWASDEYLAKRRRCTPRHIRNGIEKLESLGYIRRDTIKQGMRWSRKIYITHSRLDSNNVCERKPSSASNGTTVPHRTEPQFRKEGEVDLESETPPLPPPKSDHQDIPPPTKEEEEEIDKRFRERGKNAPKIVSIKKWRATVHKDIRAEGIAKRIAMETNERMLAESEKAMRADLAEKQKKVDGIISNNTLFAKSLPPSPKYKLHPRGVSLIGGEWNGFTVGFEEPDMIKHVTEHMRNIDGI